MSLTSLTTLPFRLAGSAVGAATHPVATAARGVGLVRGTATGLLRAAGLDRPAGSDDQAADPTTAPPEPPPSPAPGAPEPEPPLPDPDPTPDPERTAPGSVVQPEPEPGYQHTPEPEPELVYSTSTPEGVEPGTGTDEGGPGGLLDPGTAHALEAEAETMSRAADPRFGD